jgi:enamine deaminase RidA (YjgF/YER057c/UK114 family)
MKDNIQYINPDELPKNPAFSQAIITRGHGKTIYIGGQDAVNQKGEIVGKGDLKAQTGQVMQNMQAALEACGATFSDVVKMNIYLMQGQDFRQGYEVSQKFMAGIKNPPTITGIMVAGFAHPDFLLEIDAIAFVPDRISL